MLKHFNGFYKSFASFIFHDVTGDILFIGFISIFIGA